MFEQTFIPESRTNRPWTVVVAFLGQVLLVAAAILIPMAYVEPLPFEKVTTFLVAPPPPPPPPPPPAPAVHQVKQLPSQFVAGRLFEPPTVPKQVAKIEETVAPPPSTGLGVVGGIEGGQAGGVIGGILQSVASLKPAPPPPPPPVQQAAPPPPPARLVVGGDVEQAKLTHEVMPVYPVVAREAHVQGTVRLGAIIAPNGTVEQLSVISGHPLLIPSAMNAVKQWTYKPTLLNGKPIEVQTEIDVTFRLG